MSIALTDQEMRMKEEKFKMDAQAIALEIDCKVAPYNWNSGETATDRCFLIRNSDERPLFLSTSYKDRTKYCLSGYWYEGGGYNGPQNPPEIRFSKDKPIRLMVSDIKRKFLPIYEEVSNKHYAKIAVQQENEAKKQTAMQEFQDEFGMRRLTHRESSLDLYKHNSVGVDMEFSHDGQVSKLIISYIDTDKAKQILKILGY